MPLSIALPEKGRTGGGSTMRQGIHMKAPRTTIYPGSAAAAAGGLVGCGQGKAIAVVWV